MLFLLTWNKDVSSLMMKIHQDVKKKKNVSFKSPDYHVSILLTLISLMTKRDAQ